MGKLSHLRFILGTVSSRAFAVHEANTSNRTKVVALRAWALQAGCPLSASQASFAWDAVAGQSAATGTAPGLWTKDRIVAFVWGTGSFVAAERALPTQGLADALWALLRWFEATGQLLPGSDPIEDLGAALQSWAGVTWRERRAG